METIKNVRHLPLVLVLTAFFLFSCTGSAAALATSFDSYDESVVHQSLKTVSKWSSVDQYAFVKHIDKDGTESYWLSITVDRALNIDDKAEITIDGIVYKIDNNLDFINKYNRALLRNQSFAVYDLSDDLIDKIKNSQLSLSFKFYFTNRSPIVWHPDGHQTKEIKDIIDLGRDVKRD
ncbi:MAG: hypothetical protein ABFC84_01045 [Veillonellales bacterium]